MTRPTRIAALYLAVVFVAGTLFGFVAHGLYRQQTTRANRDPRQFLEEYVAKLQRDLSLTSDQLMQVTAILDQTGERFREIRKRMDPEFDAIRQQQRQQIKALLNPDQQVKYQQILDEWQRNREKRGRGK